MKIQHSPGPWKVMLPLKIEKYPSVFVATGEGKLAIDVTKSGMTLEHDIANAHLIAAAPALSAWLSRNYKGLSNYLDGMHGSCSDEKRELEEILQSIEGNTK